MRTPRDDRWVCHLSMRESSSKPVRHPNLCLTTGGRLYYNSYVHVLSVPGRHTENLYDASTSESNDERKTAEQKLNTEHHYNDDSSSSSSAASTNTYSSRPLSIVERMNRIDEELIEAARESNLPEVLRLLSLGADVNAKDQSGITPLHLASYYGHVQVVNELLEHGADIEAKSNDGFTALLKASWGGHVHVVKELMDNGADIVAKDSNGWTPLHIAAIQGHLAVVNEMLSRGADIEAQDNSGFTPLHLAGWKGLVASAQALLSGGADMLAADNRGHLPIHIAVGQGKSEASMYLLQKLYATTRRLPLHELLEDLTCIVDRNSLAGFPPLRMALHLNVLGMDDVVEIFEYLVERNPELLSSRDQDGSLPLHVACRRGTSFTIVQSLVNHCKPFVKSATPQGDLPLFLACELPETSLDTLFLLIKLYPDLVYR
jgi:ankyrin repeat protein